MRMIQRTKNSVLLTTTKCAATNRGKLSQYCKFHAALCSNIPSLFAYERQLSALTGAASPAS
jgi:hypothetical protein